MKINRKNVVLGGLLMLSLLTQNLSSVSAVTFPDIEKVKQGRAAYVVSLWTIDEKSDARKDLYCTGVLIDAYHFLTAAHCLEGLGRFIAVGGVVNKYDRGQSLAVTDIRIHPRYDAKSAQNDIAVARLYYGVDRKAEWGNFIGDYPTIPQNDKDYRSDLRLFGWGDKQNGILSSTLNSVKQKEFKSEAKKEFKDFNEATMMGAGYRYEKENLYAGACYGDSGAPLVANESNSPTLVGLVSYGSAKDCNLKKPTVYTRVAYYKNWIIKAKKEMLQEWSKSGKKPGSSPSGFSLPVFSNRFLPSEKDANGYNSYITLSTDPDTGRADLGAVMLQVYRNKTFGINLYLSKQIDGCLLRQKGTIKLQVATNSFQDVDFEVVIEPSRGCYQNGSSVTVYKVKTPPNNFSGSCSVTLEPYKGSRSAVYASKTDIDSISLQWDSRCLGKTSQLWVRVLLEIDDGKYESDLEPGIDMWVGPLNPNGK